MPLTIDELLTELHDKRAVLRGWTAAFSFSEAAVTRLAGEAWQSQPKVAMAWAEGNDGGPANVVWLELELDAPAFTLSGSPHAIGVRHPVRAATIRRGTGPASQNDWQPGDSRVTWSEPRSLEVPPDAHLAGSGPLTVTADDASPDVRVVALDLANTRFAHHGLGSTNVDHAALHAVMSNGEPRLRLASLDLSPSPSPSALRPMSLHLNVAQSASGSRSLQLLIGGPNGEPKVRSVALDTPVPDGSDFTLLIDSPTVIEDIVTHFNDEPGLVRLAAVGSNLRDSADAGAWYAETLNPMQYQGSISCGDVFPPIRNSATLVMNFKGSKREGLVVSSAAGASTNIALQLAVGGNFPLTITNEGDGVQHVKLSSGPTSVTANGAAENIAKPKLQMFLGSDISPAMGKISFDAATNLLVDRLSLPNAKPYILDAELPGDLVLAGKFLAPGEAPPVVVRPPREVPAFAPPIIEEPREAPAAIPEVAAFGANAATLANLLNQMYQNQEVLQGWDAVMNLLESSVNQFLQSQWSHQTGGAGKMQLSAIWAEGVNPFHGVYITNVTEFQIDLGAPLFQFTSGSANITVTQNILGGFLRIGTMEVPSNFNPSTWKGTFNDPSVEWEAPVTIDLSAHPSFSGTVALQQVQGLVNPTSHSLILDFAKGAFTLNNITVAGVNNSDVVNQIKNWFATNQIRYVLASLDFTSFTGKPALTPTAFQFNVVTTNAGNTIVQLLITTNGTTPPSTAINVSEPIPTADGLTCSLMVSSRILYNDVLSAGFNGSGFNLVPLSPAAPGQIWHATISPQFHFAGSFSFGNCCNRQTVTYSIYLGGIYSGSPTSGFVLTQHITPSGNVSVEIDVYAAYPVALSGSGAGQQITITPGTPSVTVSGSAENEIKSQLSDILNNNFRNGMSGISFAPVTFFALKNLVFPGNLIKMSQVQVPGDLLIVGTFSPT